MKHRIARFPADARTLKFVLASCLVFWAPIAWGHPIVPGFERLHGKGFTSDGELQRSGIVLIGELGCTNCHSTSDVARALMTPKQAPILDAVGSRVRPAFLKKYLTDPQATKPGTTMPDVLAGLPEAERNQAAEALTHYLATTGAVLDSSSSSRFAMEGDRTYHRIGCAACHGSRREGAEVAPATIPLGDLSQKYTITSLMAFLNEPHKVRPSGRMPWFHWENGNEVRNLAHYLANDPQRPLDATTRFRYFEGNFAKLPDPALLKPVASGKTVGFDLGAATAQNNYAIFFDGTIEIPADGDYNFFLFSDDGSRLFIDDKLVIDHDGTHGGSEKNGPQRLSKGLHPVRVEFFQGSGGAELRADIEGGSLGRQSLEALLRPLDGPRTGTATSQVFVPEPELAAKGRQLFSTLGCANCHQLNHNGETLKPDEFATVPPLSETIGGCLSPTPAAGRPQYVLSVPQLKAVSTALKTLAAPTPPSANAIVWHSLTTFNCIACHERNKLGGAQDELNVLFETTTKEMGDEGRLPPTLTGIGAKLTHDWLESMWDNGHKVRPYMLTRMPRFGRANLGTLTKALEEVDLAQPLEPLAVDTKPAVMKKEGRFMVGAKAFGCIKCHNFNGVASTGIQAMDLAPMSGRLKHDWFHRYLANPQVFRPGTRMPSAWPVTGKSYLPNILGGEVPTQIEAVWLYLKDGDRAPFPTGLGREPIELVAEKEPVIYRNFIEGAGPRAIGVGYPEKVNLAFDANDFRLAIIWQGAFIDASKHWVDRGAGYQGPMGDNVLRLAEGPAFAVLATPEESWPAKKSKELGMKWRGYRLNKAGQPTFLYDYAGVRIEDEPQPSAREVPSLKRVMTLTPSAPVKDLYYRAAKAGKIEALADGTYKLDDTLTIRVSGGEKPLVRSGNEVLVPLPLSGDPVQITQEYVW